MLRKATKKITRKGNRRQRRRTRNAPGYRLNLLPIQPLLHDAFRSVAIDVRTSRVGYQFVIDVRRLIGQVTWYTANNADPPVIGNINWQVINFAPVLARCAGYRAYQLLTTNLHVVCSNNEGRVVSALLNGTGFPPVGFLWNSATCNEKSLKVDTFAQGKPFTRSLKNKFDVDSFVNVLDNTFLKFVQTDRFDVFAIDCSFPVPVLNAAQNFDMSLSFRIEHTIAVTGTMGNNGFVQAGHPFQLPLQNVGQQII